MKLQIIICQLACWSIVLVKPYLSLNGFSSLSHHIAFSNLLGNFNYSLNYEFNYTSMKNSGLVEIDNYYMQRALHLARQGLGRTRPNPCVGCVLVDPHSMRIVGEGWHRAAGQPHAEVLALNQASHASRGYTAYVSLEPCNHYGKTPPCSLALLRLPYLL